MRFYARCQVCLSEIFKREKCGIAYRLSPGGPPEVHELNGKSPWAGIRCICIDCCELVNKVGPHPGKASDGVAE